MKNKVIWLSLSFLILVAMLLASCSTSSTTTTTTTTTTSSSPSTTSTVTATTTKPPTTIASTTTTTTAATGNWWNKLSAPQYGGTMTLAINSNIVQFDPYFVGGTNIMESWMEALHSDDWTMNPATFAYQMIFRPPDYIKGYLASDWEMTDPSTYVVHIRQGIRWQNIPPLNGRLFTAADVVWNYDRMYGLGDGFTKPSPYDVSDVANFVKLASVTATDSSTVVFKWGISNPEYIMETMQNFDQGMLLAAPEAVQQWGDVTDWHHAIGTGPFILTDFVSASSATLVKNPYYWGYDERYTKNQLPYVDKINYLIIPDSATAMAALRTGKIDVIEQNSLQSALSLKKTNPEILQIPYAQSGNAITLRVDTAPLNDVRVREALQMAIDLPTIASTYYNGLVSPNPVTLTTDAMTGWGFPYSQWPQDLKDQYAYNPTQAKQLLTAAGYPNGFNTDVVTDNTSDLNLLQIVQSYFAAVGVKMDIRPMDPASWVVYVLRGHKEDAMANRDGGPLNNNYSPMRQLELFMWGYPADFGLVNDPTINAYYPTAMADTIVNDIKTVVKNANEYIAQQHYALSLVEPVQYDFCQPWLNGYNGQNGAVASGYGYYLARFWINQSMKTSMGH